MAGHVGVSAVDDSRVAVALKFGSDTVRGFWNCDEIWFAAADVCRILEHADPDEGLSDLDHDEKDVCESGAIVAEMGVYHRAPRPRCHGEKPCGGGLHMKRYPWCARWARRSHISAQFFNGQVRREREKSEPADGCSRGAPVRQIELRRDWRAAISTVVVVRTWDARYFWNGECLYRGSGGKKTTRVEVGEKTENVKEVGCVWNDER